MSTKPNVTKVHKGLMHNPGGAKKTGAANKGAAKKPATQNKITPKKKYTRNPTLNTQMSTIIAAFGGALVINSFDLLVNYFAPQISGGIRTISKFVVGFAVAYFGNKTPFVGRYAGNVAASLFLAGALDVVGNYVMPKAMELLGVSTQPQIVGAATPVQNPTTGEMGLQYPLNTGDFIQLYPENGGSSFAPATAVQQALVPTQPMQRGFVY